jgi:hypothetical protein
MIRPLTLAAGAALLLASVHGRAEVTSTVIDVPNTGSSIRILDVRAANPVATLVVISGGQGFLDIHDDGSMPTTEGRCGPVARNRIAFAQHGYAVALVNDAVSASLSHIQALIDYLQTRSNGPVWLIGGSSSSPTVAHLAATLPDSVPLGLIVFSPVPVPDATASAIRRPTLVVNHAADSAAEGTALYAALTATTIKEHDVLTGGGGAPCSGYHTFWGIDDAFIGALSSFIDRYDEALVSPIAPVTVVEYYNASLDHYFITWVPAEIAILDAGVQIRGWTRTGSSFAAYNVFQPGASDICRFYIPPDKGDSHFFGRGASECDATAAAHPDFVNEDPQFMYMFLPVNGTCPGASVPIYRVFSNRPDANHRYMTDRAIRDQMVAHGWLAEGDGPDRVVMCSPA